MTLGMVYMTAVAHTKNVDHTFVAKSTLYEQFKSRSVFKSFP